MIRDLEISGFRAFHDYRVSGLGRINLVVGTNNSGKTSILEAVQLVASRGDLLALSSLTARRGERFWNDTDPRGLRSEIDIGHLFHGHDFKPGAAFKITASGGPYAGTLDGEVIQLEPPQLGLFDEPGSSMADSESRLPVAGLVLRHQYSMQKEQKSEQLLIREVEDARGPMPVPLTSRGGVPLDFVRRSRPPVANAGEIAFVATAGLGIDELVGMFEEVELTPNEDLIYEALKSIEPNVERIATKTSERRRGYPGERGAFYVKLKDSPRGVPLGVMGDGMWRMLAIALSLVRARNGILLIDEIDTGLHHTVMDRMWQLIQTQAAADKLNVQVFATTHSRDCYESLATICRGDAGVASEVTIHRLESLRNSSVAYSEGMIVAAAERGIEVR